jgi:hypothetical protein
MSVKDDKEGVERQPKDAVASILCGAVRRWCRPPS